MISYCIFQSCMYKIAGYFSSYGFPFLWPSTFLRRLNKTTFFSELGHPELASLTSSVNLRIWISFFMIKSFWFLFLLFFSVILEKKKGSESHIWHNFKLAVHIHWLRIEFKACTMYTCIFCSLKIEFWSFFGLFWHSRRVLNVFKVKVDFKGRGSMIRKSNFRHCWKRWKGLLSSRKYAPWFSVKHGLILKIVFYSLTII